ncbi:MAG: response regulator [Alphaproteobacteria bacterium]|nr:response regulator [Alphaproteobacteria bacterium]
MTVDLEMKILVIDDYYTMTMLVRGLLFSIGFRYVDEARDGASALEKLAETRYDLVISDWNMKPMSGIDLLKSLRAQGNEVPFIMVTAENTTENVLEAKAAGVSGYITKPFNAETLKKRISGVFGGFPEP